MLKSVQAGLSKRWRLRLKAGALALVFTSLSLLPWLHVLTLGAHSGHGCCHHATSGSSAGDAPALATTAMSASDTCWVCESLTSLLQHHERTDAPVISDPAPSSAFVARAPHAPVILQFYPASRSQAPPARV